MVMTTIELKQAHAERVLALLAQVQAEIALDPDNLWFGGLPPSFEELNRICAHRADNIRSVFQLPTPVAE
jgi:hypothetical protein